MRADSVEFLPAHAGLRVFFDAEHFFDGYRRNPAFSLRVLRAAEEAGAETPSSCATPATAAPCPDEVERVLQEVIPVTSPPELGVHFHNDGACAVANTMTAVRLGV